jgi:hypothetical protein
MGKLVLRKTILRNMIDRVWAPLLQAMGVSASAGILSEGGREGARKFSSKLTLSSLRVIS